MGAVSAAVSAGVVVASAVLAEDFPAVAGFPEDFKKQAFSFQHLKKYRSRRK